MPYDRPGLILYTAITAFGYTAGLSAARYWGGGLDAYLTMGLIDSVVSLIVANFLAHDYDEWQEERKRLNEIDGRQKPWATNQPAEQKRTLLDMNTGKPIYSFQTPAVKIDHMSRKIKHFCIVLVNQHDQGFKIDLREETWKGHFGGRDNYVNVRDVRLAGAFAKESSRTNSPFVVARWEIVEDGAKGRL